MQEHQCRSDVFISDELLHNKKSSLSGCPSNTPFAIPFRAKTAGWGALLLYMYRTSTYPNFATLPMTTPLALELDALPTTNVAAFVADFARQHGVVYRRTYLDAWCDAVTRVSGDEVTTDTTGDLLVALTRAKLLTGEQMARLLTNHLRERRSTTPAK